ncbi:hypothetical protein PanWU01x14_284690, partial [Parasponia andersonii]
VESGLQYVFSSKLILFLCLQNHKIENGTSNKPKENAFQFQVRSLRTVKGLKAIRTSPFNSSITILTAQSGYFFAYFTLLQQLSNKLQTLDTIFMIELHDQPE